MAYKCLFMDNDIYTAQDVNDALSSIVSGGVSGYPFGNSAMAGLNTAIAELANEGIDYHGTSCQVINENGAYKVSEGACIMNDGSQIIFDSDGYVIETETGVTQYVYLERDVLHNTINVVVSETSGGQDTIPLAEIRANGTVIDRRKFAKARVSIMAEPQNISVTASIVYSSAPGEPFAVDVGFNGWKYIICETDSKTFYIKLPDGEAVSGFPVDRYSQSLVPVYISRNGSVLTLTNNASAMLNFNIEFELR